MVQLVSFETLGALLRVNPEYYGAQAEVIADTLGYTGEPVTLRAAVRKVRSKLEHDTAETGRYHGVNVWLARIAQELNLSLPAGYEASRGRRALAELQQKQHALVIAEDSLVDVLVGLKRSGIRIAHVCTTGLISSQSVRSALVRLRLAEMIDVELYSDELGYAMPDHRIYESLMRSSGLMPHDMLHVGGNTLGALDAGMQAVRYLPGGNDTPPDAIRSHRELLDRLSTTPC